MYAAVLKAEGSCSRVHAARAALREGDGHDTGFCCGYTSCQEAPGKALKTQLAIFFGVTSPSGSPSGTHSNLQFIAMIRWLKQINPTTSSHYSLGQPMKLLPALLFLPQTTRNLLPFLKAGLEISDYCQAHVSCWTWSQSPHPAASHKPSTSVLLCRESYAELEISYGHFRFTWQPAVNSVAEQASQWYSPIHQPKGFREEVDPGLFNEGTSGWLTG